MHIRTVQRLLLMYIIALLRCFLDLLVVLLQYYHVMGVTVLIRGNLTTLGKRPLASPPNTGLSSICLKGAKLLHLSAGGALAAFLSTWSKAKAPRVAMFRKSQVARRLHIRWKTPSKALKSSKTSQSEVEIRWHVAASGGRCAGHRRVTSPPCLREQRHHLQKVSKSVRT